MSLLTEQRPTDYGERMDKRLGYGGPTSEHDVPEHTVTVPYEVWNRLGLDKPGAIVEYISRDGDIVLRPRVAVHPNDVWFWEEGQQQAEREAEEEIAAGELGPGMSGEEFLAELERLSHDNSEQES